MENYFFDVDNEIHGEKVFVLIIYDIENNKARNKLAKFLSGYGFRVQKSAFEAEITKKKYKEMMECLPRYVDICDSIRVYKIVGKGQVTNFGRKYENEIEDVIII